MLFCYLHLFSCDFPLFCFILFLIFSCKQFYYFVTIALSLHVPVPSSVRGSKRKRENTKKCLTDKKKNHKEGLYSLESAQRTKQDINKHRPLSPTIGQKKESCCFTFAFLTFHLGTVTSPLTAFVFRCCSFVCFFCFPLLRQPLLRRIPTHFFFSFLYPHPFSRRYTTSLPAL